MKAGLVLFRVNQFNLLLRSRLRMLHRMLADFLEGFHNPALRLFQPTPGLHGCAILRNPHRGSGGRTAPTFKSSFRLQLPLLALNPPTGVRSKRMTSWKEARFFFGTLFDSCANVRAI